MATEVVMPQMGESIAEGTITKWMKQVGERIERDEALLEISTDKVDTEIPSPAAGVLVQIVAEEGATVEVGTVIAMIGEEGEKVDAPAAAKAPAPAQAEEAPAAPEPVAAPVAVVAGGPSAIKPPLASACHATSRARSVAARFQAMRRPLPR